MNSIKIVVLQIMDVLQCPETGYITLSQSCKKGLTSYCISSIVVLCEWDWFLGTLSYTHHISYNYTATFTQKENTVVSRVRPNPNSAQRSGPPNEDWPPL